MKVNIEKFKEFLKDNINVCEKNKERHVEKGTTEDLLQAIAYKQERDCWEYLLNAFNEPEEHDWLEE